MKLLPMRLPIWTWLSIGGSGIPRIIDKVKAAGLREPEFIGGEVDLRINIYRGQVDTNSAMINANGIKKWH